MYSLSLNIQPGNWHVFSGRKADPAFAGFQEKVFQRDGYTCQYCGFQAQEHQEVVNLDGDYTNNRLGNMVTACVFCTQCGFLDAVGSAFGGGKLVHIPEMTQVELNSFCHVMFCAMTNKTGYMDTAQTTYRHLRLRSKAVEGKFGKGTGDPATFAQLILNNQFDPQQKHELFSELRLLPSYAKFKTQLSDWAAAAAKELSQEE